MIDVKRRRFLLNTGLLAVTGTLPHFSLAATTLRYQAAAFDALHDRVVLWVGHDGPAQVQIQYRIFSAPTYQTGPLLELSATNGFCNHALVTSLQPGQLYQYQIVTPTNQQIVSGPHTFKTAPASPARFSFVFSADISEAHQPYTLFKHMAAVQPDFFLLLGDTAYTDYPSELFKPSLTYYRGKHANVRNDPHIQNFLSRHTTYAVWDDHEVENNFHAQHPHLAEGLQAFRDYWPGLTVHPQALYRQFHWSGADFFILDTRYYRSPQDQEEGPGKTMLGQQQKHWLKESLKKSTAMFKFIITSVPFHGHSSDTWGNYTTERDELAWFIQSNEIKGIIFLSGDYHMAREFRRQPDGLHEYMAGPIASFSLLQRRPQYREALRKLGDFFYGDGPNFGYWEVDPNKGTATVEYRDHTGKILHKARVNKS